MMEVLVPAGGGLAILTSDNAENDIAIVGMAARFPGADTVSQYWKNLRDGVESIRAYTEEELIAAGENPELIRRADYVRAGAPLQGMEMFDGDFFGFSPKERAILDPQHRHFLECVWEALEDAAHMPGDFDGPIGLYGGCGMGSYFYFNLCSNPSLVESEGMFLLRHTGNDKDFLVTRVAYLLDLKGPAVNVQTACSTSLVAVHMACQSLLSGECDMALAGGVTIEIPHRRGYLYREGEVLSPDGHCRAFDASAAGTVFGSGSGVVVLRRLEEALEDGDHIYAVVRGSAINNDGAAKVGYLAPSVDGQAGAMAEAYAVAGVSPDEIGYVECHGTGTNMGDPIELEALTQAFRTKTQRVGFCRIGSVKTNIGHLDTAAGVASLIKASLALHHKQMPPSLNYEAPNPNVAMSKTPFVVNDRLTDWGSASHPRVAAVNSLGVGGTNAHVVLAEAPISEPSSPTEGAQLFMISGRTRTALQGNATRLAQYLREEPDTELADVAYTLHVGRQAFDERSVVVARSPEEAATLIEDGDPRRVFKHTVVEGTPSVAFMFPGGGSQQVGMGARLYEQDDVFRKHVDHGLSRLRELCGVDLAPLWFPDEAHRAEAESALDRMPHQLPAIFIVEYALVQLWKSWGIEPTAMIGHSVGENVAACVAGVMSFDDCIRLLHLRGILFERVPESAMVSVAISVEQIDELLQGECDLAAVNAPELCVVSGSLEEVTRFEARAAKRGVDTRRIAVPVAAHSRMLEPVLGDFRSFLRSIELARPKIPFVSNRTGTWITDEEAQDPEYWVGHLRNSVRFTEGVGTILQAKGRVLVEVGAGQTLSSLARMHPSATARLPIVPSLPHRDDPTADTTFFLSSVGRAWACGLTPDLARLWQGQTRVRLSLPTYAFDHHPYFVEPMASVVAETHDVTHLSKIPAIDNWGYRESWREVEAPAAARTDATTWLLFIDDTGVGAKLRACLVDQGHRVISVEEGDGYLKKDDNHYTLSPERGRSGYDALVRDLMASGGVPDRIAHLWLVTNQETFRPGSSFFHRNLAVGFHSLFFFAQALGDENVPVPLELTVVSSDAQQVFDEAVPYPEKATVLGPCRVIPHEMPGFETRLVDVALPPIDRKLSDIVLDLARSIVRKRDRESAIDQIAAELERELRAESDDQVVAYRDGRRYAQWFEPRELPETSPEDRKLREGGVYLITGGLGDLGLNLARFLAERYRAKVILLSRRDPTGTKSRALTALETLGAEVMTLRADVSNLQSMTRAVDAARARFGVIHGVFHAAGLVRDDLIQLKNEADIDSVFAPKVHGTVVLESLFGHDDLDFMVLFSSVSAITAPVGQVDYAAANAFMDAFARSKRRAGRTEFLSINWGIWKDIGIAARAFSGASPAPDVERQPCTIEYPLFDARLKDSHGKTVLTTELRCESHWVLDQHRTLAGEALIPGTGYIELLRAALREFGEKGPFEVSNLFFLRPLHVPDRESREARVKLLHSAEGYDVQVRSECELDGRRGFQLHADARVRLDDIERPDRIDVAAIGARCTEERGTASSDTLPNAQGEHLRFGARWEVLRSVAFGDGEALAKLSLARRFRDESRQYGLHPALLDIATGYAMRLIDGYQGRELWVPVSYGKIRVYGDLPPDVVSWVRMAGQPASDSDFARFDVTVATVDGEVLLEASDFTIKRMGVGASFALDSKPTASEVEFENVTAVGVKQDMTATERQLQRNMEQGIGPEEGTEALTRALAMGSEPRVVITSLDLDDLVAQAASQFGDSAEGGLKFERPNLDSEYKAPSDDIERTLVGVWGELLGVDKLGVQDSFFDLGGHSLMALRLFARIEKAYNVDFPISVLFEAPTIESCATLIRDAMGDTEQSAGARESKAPRPRYKHLVAMHSNVEAQRTPFFLVAGMFGNVLNLRHLANLVGVERPFYGLQARGLYGDEPPHDSFEEMASDYIAELRTVQPHGPYMLGGFSGGGITALEMARQLRATGEEVALLLLLDTPLPRRPPLTRKDRALVKIQEIKQRGPGYIPEWARNRAAWELAQLKKRLEREATPTHTPDQFRNDAIEHAFREALERYTLHPHDGPLVLFRPKLDRAYELGDDRVLDSAKEWIWEDNGWSPFCTEVEVHEMPGDHDSMVLEPNVRVMAEHLRACIQRAERQIERPKKSPSRAPASGFPAPKPQLLGTSH